MCLITTVVRTIEDIGWHVIAICREETILSAALTKITTEIVSAYVAKNHLRPDELVVLLKNVHGKVNELANGKAEPQVATKPEPLMPIKKTVTPGYLISLEDGRQYKTLRRHLTIRGMTPDDYRAKWGLPADYPMVAKDYADRRSALAKSIGLGRKAVPTDPAQAIANDLVDVIAEDVIGDEVGKEEIGAEEAPTATEETSRKKAARKVTPHPKPKDRAKAAKTPKQAQEAV